MRHGSAGVQRFERCTLVRADGVSLAEALPLVIRHHKNAPPLPSCQAALAGAHHVWAARGAAGRRHGAD